MGPATSLYEKRKKQDLLHELWNCVNAADNRLSRRRFQFVGEPVASAQSAIELSGAPLQGSAAEEVSGLDNTALVLSSQSHVVLRSISRCEVASSSTLPSVHVDGAFDSIFVLHSDGAVSVRNAKNCHLVIKCHQARLHDLENCTVWVHVAGGRVIIEHCRNITFGGYDGDTGTLTSPHFAVDDFDWPTRRIASPHYRLIPSGRAVVGLRLPSIDGEWGKNLRLLLQTGGM